MHIASIARRSALVTLTVATVFGATALTSRVGHARDHAVLTLSAPEAASRWCTS